MPRRCLVCDHPERAAIERALLLGKLPITAIAATWELPRKSVSRHRDKHLPEVLAQAQDAQAKATDLMEELKSCIRRITLLFDACDRWLRDAENPDQYDIGPRAGDISVTYWEDGPSGKRVKRKAKLSALLAEVTSHNGRGRTIELVETKHADPRELVLKTAARLHSQIELLARLLGELQAGAVINIVLAPEWVALRTTILTALRPYPDAGLAVARALGDGHA